MTINEIKNEISGLTKTQRLEKSKMLIQKFVVEAEDFAARRDVDLDFKQIVVMIFAAAIGADGDLIESEYDAYADICNAIGAVPTSYSDCLAIAEEASDIIGIIEDMSLSLKTTFEPECINKFITALACLMLDDDELNGEELRLLAYYIDDEDSCIDNSSKSTVESARIEEVKLIDYEASFTRTDDDDYYFTVGAELKNPNRSYCARNVSVRVIVKDASGRILETSENVIDYIDSNATFYYGDEFCVSRGVPKNYVVQVNCDDYVEAPENSTFSDGIVCSHYSVNSNRWGGVEFTGNVHNGYNKKLWVDLYFAFYNSSGKITGGTNTRVTLYGSSDDVFECYLRTRVSRDKVRCSATFDFMDLID